MHSLTRSSLSFKGAKTKVGINPSGEVYNLAVPTLPIKPNALKPGDTIAIVTPASSIDEDRLTRGCALIEARGYKTKLMPHVYDQHYYLGGTDENRAADLMAAFRDPECAGVMCSRGGYGCARLLPHLDLDEMAQSGKFFAGFSDITTLHLALNRRGLVTFHTPMPITLSYDRAPWVHESFFELLVGNAARPADAKRGDKLVGGVGEGVVTGGCLCLLCDSIGTADALDTRGKILLIEDVDENPHRIDAMLTHLLHLGMLQTCAGIVIGEMTNTDEKSDPTMGGRPWLDIVTDRIAPLGVPTVVNYPFGHMKTMLSLPLGIRARLDADAGVLEYLESPCE